MPIALMFLGCWLWWPLGLAILALFFIGHWMWWPLGLLDPGLHHRERTNGLLEPPRHEPLAEQNGSHAGKDGSRARRMGTGGGDWWHAAPSSGNRAFDDYRTETLKRLEEEQREFRDFLDRLRFAKDKTEFDQFMAERRNRRLRSAAAGLAAASLSRRIIEPIDRPPAAAGGRCHLAVRGRAVRTRLNPPLSTVGLR